MHFASTDQPNGLRDKLVLLEGLVFLMHLTAKLPAFRESVGLARYTKESNFRFFLDITRKSILL